MGVTDGSAGAGLLRRLRPRVGDAAFVALVLALGWLLWPSSFGGCTTLTIVAGQSMEPTYYTGDLVVSRCGPVEVGDVVVYSPPDVGGARVIHRIVGGDADGWVVQGDNNDFLDPWNPTAENVLGTAVLRIPNVGSFASILLSPVTWISLLLLALALVVWPASRAPAEGGDADAGVAERSEEVEDVAGALPGPPA